MEVQRLRGQQGIALPAAVMILFIASLLGLAMFSSASFSGNQASRDRNTKRAVAAADGGIDVAMYRLNKLQPSALQCVVAGTLDLLLESILPDGWCQAQTETLEDGTTYSYRISGSSQVTLNGQSLLRRRIVSTGIANGVKRRVLAVVSSLSGASLFGGYAVISLTDLDLENGATIQGNAASNGNVSIANNSEICGNITYGPGKQLMTSNSGQQCPGYTAAPAVQSFLLNPVDQGTAATVNDNARIGVLDTWTNPSQITWNPATRVLKLGQNSSLTLTGDIYSFCYLEIANSAQLRIASRAPGRPPLKIYMDAPENCGVTPDRGSVKLNNLGSISNPNSDPTTFYLYARGSPATPTSIEFSDNFSVSVPMMIYAPQSSVSFRNSTGITGAVAAKTVWLKDSGTVTWDQRADAPIDDLLPLFRRQSWSECNAQQTGQAADSGC